MGKPPYKSNMNTVGLPMICDVLSMTSKGLDLVFLLCFHSQGCRFAQYALCQRDSSISVQPTSMYRQVIVSQFRIILTLFSIISPNEELTSDLLKYCD